VSLWSCHPEDEKIVEWEKERKTDQTEEKERKEQRKGERVISMWSCQPEHVTVTRSTNATATEEDILLPSTTTVQLPLLGCGGADSSVKTANPLAELVLDLTRS